MSDNHWNECRNCAPHLGVQHALDGACHAPLCECPRFEETK